MGRQILVVEDNKDIAKLLEMHLADLDCGVDAVASGTRGLEEARRGHYDLIILDIMLPGMDGLEVCRRLRGEDNNTPILMLTAKGTEVDRVVGLEIGADDYLTKPFSIRELLARVKAIFRRIDTLSKPDNAPATGLITLRDLSIDADKRKVVVAGREVELTAKEFDLLHHFARHPGRVFSRAQLLDEVWGYGHVGYEHTVNSHINRLRTKIERDAASPKFVLTVWGVGYKFADREDQAEG